MGHWTWGGCAEGVRFLGGRKPWNLSSEDESRLEGKKEESGGALCSIWGCSTFMGLWERMSSSGKDWRKRKPRDTANEGCQTRLRVRVRLGGDLESEAAPACTVA